ncbi:hypothetical protein [Pseudomonas fontis]|uniref:Uncharacterized protein n=1 Tax=Pseudomonas fontis TaxID=2942633 RepID=A0ABT5NU58_9PSED|nr:hypothetical protein [Pseudomonas fontis]MDD0977341.1 hypothetical protein [Pseudomonas fontis]MDD0991709.1 hypothetical protein [Pseudomonas fontis]
MAAADGSNKTTAVRRPKVRTNRDVPTAFPNPRFESGVEPDGLLLRSQLDLGVTVLIDRWDNPPGDGEFNELFVQLARAGSENYESVVDEETEGQITFPRKLVIPSDYLLAPSNEGPFKLRIEQVNQVGNTVWSEIVPIVIDKTPPHNPDFPEKIKFSFTPPITDATLDGLSYLEGEIPEWKGEEVGDRVAFAWLENKLPTEPGDLVPIDTVILGLDRKVKFPVAVIRASKDGLYTAGYVILDRAGNLSKVSQIDLMSVALGPAPKPLVEPVVPDFDSNGIIDLADAMNGVEVRIPPVPNGKETDELEIWWGDKPLVGRWPVRPGAQVPIPVTFKHLLQAFGHATTPVATDVRYIVYRGVEPFDSDVLQVQVDLSTTGPVNPGWPDDPDPTNPTLELPQVFGKSGEANKLVAADENQEVYASIKLVAPVADDDTYQLYWNDVPIGDAYKVDLTQVGDGDEIRIPLDWNDIRKQRNNKAMPVYYTLGHPDRRNLQTSNSSSVDIDFLVVVLPKPVALDLDSKRKILNCSSLKEQGGMHGFRYHIPASEYLKVGDVINISWKAFQRLGTPEHVPAADKDEDLYITADHVLNGINWFVGPYDKHILPIYAGEEPDAQSGRGKVQYTLDVGGKSTPSAISDEQVSIATGTGTCPLP